MSALSTSDKRVSVSTEICLRPRLTHNHFNHQRHLESRTDFKSLRDATLIEWREVVLA